MSFGFPSSGSSKLVTPKQATFDDFFQLYPINSNGGITLGRDILVQCLHAHAPIFYTRLMVTTYEQILIMKHEHIPLWTFWPFLMSTGVEYSLVQH